VRQVSERAKEAGMSPFRWEESRAEGWIHGTTVRKKRCKSAQEALQMCTRSGAKVRKL
jgi:hypothetical protein